MMRLVLPSLLALFLFTGSSEARLGETLAQCEERYGPVVEKRPASVKESDPDACVFTKSGITTLIEFRGGIAWRILFRMMTMTASDAETLLKANMSEGGWSSALKINDREYRLSSDRRRVAIYSPGLVMGEISTLVIASRDYGAANYAAYSQRMVEALDRITERKTTKELKGF